MALKSLDDARVRSVKRRWSDGLQPYKWIEGWQKLRIFGDIYTDAVHTVKTKTGKYYPEYCHAYDWQNDRFLDDRGAHCEACRLKMKVSVRHYANVISLDAFEKMPRNPPPDWTCIFMVDLAPSLVEALFNLKPMNDNFPVTDLERGALLSIKYDPKAPTPANTYYAAVKTPGYAIDPEILKMTLVQEMADGKRVVHRANGSVPPQWVYVRGTQSSVQEMKDSLRRNGHYGEEAATASPEVTKAAEGVMSELLALDDNAPAKPSNVRQMALLHETPEPDAAPPPRATKPAAVAVNAPAPAAAPEEDLEIPF